MTARNVKTTMLAICFLALAVRLPGMSWGIVPSEPQKILPYVVDEIQMSKIAMEFSEGLVWQDEQHYPKGYPFQLAAVSSFFNHQNGGSDFYKLIISGRIVSILYSIFSILLLYFLAQEITSDIGVALFSSTFLALSGSHVVRSHLAMPDVTVTFWIYALMFTAFLYIRTKKMIYLALMLISSGIALAVKLSFIVIVPIIYICVKGKWNWRMILLAIFSVFMVFYFAGGGKYTWTTFSNSLVDVYEDNLVQRQFNKWLNLPCYFIISIVSLGLPVFLLSLVGAWKIFRSKVKFNYSFGDIFFVAALPLMLHFISICCIAYSAGRHMLPLIPFMCMLAGVGIVSIKQGRLFKVQFSFSVLLLSVFIYQLLYVGSIEYSCVKDTREVAAEWIQKNIPKGESLALLRYAEMPSLAKNYRIVDVEQAQYLVLHETYYSRYYKSIINPFNSYPKWEEVGHGRMEDFHLIQNIFRGGSEYKLVKKFEVELFTPDMFVLRRTFGSLWDALMGDVLIFEKRSQGSARQS